MKLGKETGSIFNWAMSNNTTIPETGKDGTELCWTDRRSFRVIDVSKDGKSGIAAFYVDCYDTLEPLGTELEKQTFRFKFRYGKWRKEVEDCMGRKSYVAWNVIFGVRNGYYDMEF